MSTKKKAQSAGRTVLICDPTCVLPYGHAVPALNHFRNDLSARFDAVKCLASKGLPIGVSDQYDFDRRFTFLYNRYIPIMSASQASNILSEHESYDSDYADPFERIATHDAASVLSDYALSKDDVIFFPGGDFYGVIGFVNALLALPASSRPVLYVRLIGVLENASPYYDDPLGQFLQRIKAATADGLIMRLSAETPDYADLVSRTTGQPTLLTPYPETAKHSPLPTSDDFTVLSAGSARIDKGFLDLYQIWRDVLVAPPQRMGVKLISQTLPLKDHDSWDSYTSQLYALRGVTLLDTVITSEEMSRLYEISDIVLLPYSQGTYKLRGSAVMMEAASVGRLCVTLKGTAFAKQVEYYGLGETVEKVSDMPAVIRRLANGGRAEMAERIRQARARFYVDVKGSYDSWFQPGDAR